MLWEHHLSSPRRSQGGSHDMGAPSFESPAVAKWKPCSGSHVVPTLNSVLPCYGSTIFRVPGGHKVETLLWLARRAFKKWGDVYLHETVIAHVRRLLDNEFTCTRLGETPSQFATRMRKVQDFMNSPAFAAPGGGRGFEGLAKDLRRRCQEVKNARGERIPH